MCPLCTFIRIHAKRGIVQLIAVVARAAKIARKIVANVGARMIQRTFVNVGAKGGQGRIGSIRVSRVAHAPKAALRIVALRVGKTRMGVICTLIDILATVMISHVEQVARKTRAVKRADIVGAHLLTRVRPELAFIHIRARLVEGDVSKCRCARTIANVAPNRVCAHGVWRVARKQAFVHIKTLCVVCSVVKPVHICTITVVGTKCVDTSVGHIAARGITTALCTFINVDTFVAGNVAKPGQTVANVAIRNVDTGARASIAQAGIFLAHE